MYGPLRSLGIAAALTAALLGVGALDSAATPTLRVVAFGDSFTATLDPTTLQDDETLSWATGDRLPGLSIVQRLEAQGWQVQDANVAKSGERARHLPQQLERAPSEADLVIIWIGINDLCTPSATATMLADDAHDAFSQIRNAYPEAQVLVLSPPSLVHIGRQHEALPEAVRLWSGSSVCTHFFGQGQPAAAGREREAAFERVLRVEADEQGFHYSTSLQTMNRPLSAWATWDYLHPSDAGSAMFAERAWPDVARIVGNAAD